MAKATIDFGATELSAKVVEALEKNFDKKVIAFVSKNEDLDLESKFEKSTVWQSGLWDTVSVKVGVKVPGKPRKIVSNIDEPGAYNVELELWDRTLKFKLSIASPASGDKTARVIRKNSNPPHVSVRNSGAKLNACPTLFVSDMKSLINKMGKTASYTYVGGTGSSKGWKPKFAGHQCHEQPGKGWKAYIDEPSSGTGTTWRLYFTADFDIPTKTLRVATTQVSEDH